MRYGGEIMLSEKIKKYRLDNGLTQEELAKALHSSQNTISNYENGIRTPTVKKLIAIATLFGCSVSDLIGEFSYSPAPSPPGAERPSA